MKTEYKLGYYAHSKKKYNTEFERSEYNFLKRNFNGLIICPNIHIGNMMASEPYHNMVKKADIIFVSEYEDYIGRGVYEECKLAVKLKKPVYVVRFINGQFYFFSLHQIRKLEKNSTLIKYGKLITKKSSPKQLFT
jgi:hypothetical protein